MEQLWIPVAVVSAIGLIAGVILAIVSKVFAVPVDERVEKVRDLLPGANCGGCGFSGCDGYAAAVAEGADCSLCTVGGAETAAAIAAVMGVEAGTFVRKVAVVRCSGSESCTGTRFDYSGYPSCAAAVQLGGGPGNCAFGCIGLGDCVAACDREAVAVKEGVAVVDPVLCGACGQCAKACPKGLIAILPEKTRSVHCRNTDKGPAVRKVCSAGCIGCGMCAKACPSGAIKVENFLAEIDPALCTGCAACEEKCPVKVIRPVCRPL